MPKVVHEWFYFDMDGYIERLDRNMSVALNKATDLLYRNIRRSLGAVTFKDNEVKIAGGMVTSDADRKMSVLNSMGAKQVLTKVAKGILHSTVYAMRNDFANSHVGVYYEFGIGDEVEESDLSLKYKNLGDWNPYRSGRTIVSRSQAVNEGFWTDMGGNVRHTRQKFGGMRTPQFINAYGGDVKAYHWFYGTIEATIPEIEKIIMYELNRSNPLKFFKVKKKIVIGK